MPYLLVDARYEHVRVAGAVTTCALLIAVGTTPEGRRTMLGASVALSEAEVHWRELFADCYDNVFMESCFGTIKTELEMTECPDSRRTRADTANYLAYYNHERRHSAHNYLAPAVFEGQPPSGN